MDVVILDTGCANLTSVTAAVQRLGYTPVVSREKNVVLNADKLLLPGVGTATAAMQQLMERDLIELIKRCTQPVLGICLGMQILGTVSRERGDIPTLDIIPGEVRALETAGLPLPHMGWNQITTHAGHPLFRHIDPDSYFYFVHSYAMPVSEYTIAQCQYGETFSAAIQRDNFYGVQFHPERSGAAGAQLIKNFLEMA